MNAVERSVVHEYLRDRATSRPTARATSPTAGSWSSRTPPEGARSGRVSGRAGGGFTWNAAASERLAAVAARHGLRPAAQEALRVVLELLAREPTAITSVRDPVAAVDLHVADSLVGLELADVREARAIADLGAGGGFPGLALAAAAAFALGAIVSPTDAVATEAVTARLPLPSRAMHILNGESLINDASGLVAFRFAIAAVATGAFSWLEAGVSLVLLAGGGALAGVAVAALIGGVRIRLMRFCVDDPTIQTMLSLLTPYAAYRRGARIRVGDPRRRRRRFLRRHPRHEAPLGCHSAPRVGSVGDAALRVQRPRLPAARPAAQERARAIAGRVVVEPCVLCAGRMGRSCARAARLGLPGYLPAARFGAASASAKVGATHAEVFLVGWAGIRGSVTLAAALSIPFMTSPGTPFPGRSLILFLAGTTIVLTLAINGLTLPAFISWLALRRDGGADSEERAARLAVAQVAANALRVEIPKLGRPEEVAFAERLIADYETRFHRHSANLSAARASRCDRRG